MKKTVLSIALALVTAGVFAQETGGMTSKKGETILPEANDWALSIDATPVMNYLGRFLSNAGSTSPTWGYPGTPLAITGKMFKDEKTAYRGMLRLGFGSTNANTYVAKVGSTTNETVTDSKKVGHNNIILGGGLEMRRGKTRLQGFYGGMLMFGIGGSDTTYSYGNAIAATNPVAARTTENKAGGTFMLGLRGFIGAEYFIFPKMAVGAEFGWGLAMSSTGEGEKTVEGWDAATSASKSTTTKTGKSSSFGLDTDVNGAQMIPTGVLTLTLHF